MSKKYIKLYLSEPCADIPSICVKPFISSPVPLPTTQQFSIIVER